MTKYLPYKLLPIKHAFTDYPGGAKGFLEAHGDYVSNEKDCYVAVVEDDFTNLTAKTCDATDIFGAEIILPNDDANLSAIVFKKNVILTNCCYADVDSDFSPSLIVEGNLTARALSLSGGHTQINGNCTITEAIYGHYNHGELTVNGTTNTPFIIADDFSMTLNGPVVAQYMMGTDWKTLAPLANVPIWDVANDAKKIKAVMDSFYLEEYDVDEYGFDDALMHTAMMVGDCVLKDKPVGAKKRNKADYVQISDKAKQQLAVLQAQLADNMSVTALQFANSNMCELPTQLKQFTSAQTINLRSNGITKLPAWLQSFSNLQHLDVSNNPIKKLALSPEQQANLQSLNITNTQIVEIENAYKNLPQLNEFCLGKKDDENNEKIGRLALDFEWSRTPKLQHLHIADSGWMHEWDYDFGFYQCSQLKYLQFGYAPIGAMGKQLSHLQQLQYYGFETGFEKTNQEPCKIDIEVLASLPNLAMLHIGGMGFGMDKDKIDAIRQRLPKLYISAPNISGAFAQENAFKQLNQQLNMAKARGEATQLGAIMKDMLQALPEHKLAISPKMFELTAANLLKHCDETARNCKMPAKKPVLIKQFYDATVLLKPLLPKTASWTHLMPNGYDLWEKTHMAEVWYALRREDHSAEHLNWALKQLAICLPVEQKQGHRKEFAGLYELALQMQT